MFFTNCQKIHHFQLKPEKENAPNFDAIFRQQNTTDLKMMKSNLKIKKDTLKKEKSLENLEEWYSKMLNSKLIENSKKRINEKVKRMITVIYPIGNLPEESTKVEKIFPHLVKSNLQSNTDTKLENILINKYNSQIAQKIVKKSILRDIKFKSLAFNGNYDCLRLIDRRSKSLINNYDSLKNSIKLGHIDSKLMAEKINKKLFPQIKQKSISRNILIEDKNKKIVNKLRSKNLNEVQKSASLVDVNELKSSQIENQDFPAQLETLYAFKDQFYRLRRCLKLLKKQLELKEIGLFKLSNQNHLKLIKYNNLENTNEDAEKLKFNELLFQGQNLENIRLDIKLYKLQLNEKRIVLKEQLILVLRNLKYFK